LWLNPVLKKKMIYTNIIMIIVTHLKIALRKFAAYLLHFANGIFYIFSEYSNNLIIKYLSIRVYFWNFNFSSSSSDNIYFSNKPARQSSTWIIMTNAVKSLIWSSTFSYPSESIVQTKTTRAILAKHAIKILKLSK